jgi:hypothetical protein
MRRQTIQPIRHSTFVVDREDRRILQLRDQLVHVDIAYVSHYLLGDGAERGSSARGTALRILQQMLPHPLEWLNSARAGLFVVGGGLALLFVACELQRLCGYRNGAMRKQQRDRRSFICLAGTKVRPHRNGELC